MNQTADSETKTVLTDAAALALPAVQMVLFSERIIAESFIDSRLVWTSRLLAPDLCRTSKGRWPLIADQ